MTYNYTLIDPNIIQANLMQNNALIAQFLQLYLVQIPVDLSALNEAMDSKDPIEISNKAHHIKPTMEYIGATSLRTELQELETAAKNGADMQQLKKLFDILLPQFNTLFVEIKDYLDQL